MQNKQDMQDQGGPKFHFKSIGPVCLVCPVCPGPLSCKCSLWPLWALW